MDDGEECDDGEANADDAPCTAACKLATCGDGLVNEGVEACDDGNDNDADACSNTCAAAGCGDGVLQAFEDCDDGNDLDTDACLNTCVNAKCGDGKVQAGVEECDDANADDADGCLATCKVQMCGDGLVQGGEQCDDGNMVDTDACLPTCVNATCGDGKLFAGVEQCDDGNANEADGCAACKKGIMAFGEFRPAMTCANFVNNGNDYRQHCFTLKGQTLCTGQTSGGQVSCTDLPNGLRFVYDFNATWPMRFNNNQAICANYHPDFIANFALAVGYAKATVTQTKIGNNCTRTYIDANGTYQSTAGDAAQAQIYTVDYTN
jgi:cysteine-rich repeat protein